MFLKVLKLNCTFTFFFFPIATMCCHRIQLFVFIWATGSSGNQSYISTGKNIEN